MSQAEGPSRFAAHVADRTAGPLPLPTATEMREVERLAFGQGGVDERVVLESAGRAAAMAVAREFPDGRVVAAVGRGNNGGDAIVALRTLQAWGRDVSAVPVAGGSLPEGLTHGWAIPTSEDTAALATAGVVLDGILGTGASGALRPPIADIVERMNASSRPIIAIDGPTGVDLDTGRVAGAAVRAVLTVTFGALKRGLLLFPAREHAGRILLAEVGFPPMDRASARASLVTDSWARQRVPAISPDAHKGSVGLVGIVSGRSGVGGAAIMAAMGALRAGSGGVRIASAEANRGAIHAAVPEAVFLDREGSDLLESLRGTAAILIGPGIGVDDHAIDLLRAVLDGHDGPFVIDADALTLIARDPDLVATDVGQRSVFTPHPGELGRLLGRRTEEVLEDRFDAAEEAARRFGCTVLAKGAPSLVAKPGEPTLVSVAGHSGVATGGMGDTLGGVVAALLAGGASPRDAAGAGVHYAGRAAEAAGRGRGLLPRDVAEALPAVLVAPPTAAPPVPFLLDIPAPR
jgi:ADP-dependent NAD(P)H-hydrate dehydratase / NAD(P)H-hydrate epimerase